MTRRAPRVAAAGLVAGLLAIAIMAVPVPSTPPPGERGDGNHYAAMAAHPLEEVAPSPYAQRLGVPLAAAALPFGLGTSFLVLSVAGLLAAGALVGLVAREVGVPPIGQVICALLTVGSYIGVHGLYIPYYVDPETVALVALALLLALRRRLVLLAAALVVGVLVKEVAATLFVVPYLLDRRRRGILDRGALVRTAAVVAPAAAAFAAVHLLAPALATPDDDLRFAFVEMGIASRGFATSIANPLVALFGVALVLWPVGVLVGPPDLRRLHVWAALAAPLLAFGHWERTFGAFLPLALPSALLALRAASPAVVSAFAAGSFWTTAVVGAVTIGEGATPIAEKAALMAPGVLVAGAALAFHVLGGRQRAQRAE